MTYDYLRTETYTDSEGDEAKRLYYRGEDGKQYVTGPGYFMLPLDDEGNLILPKADAVVRVVNYTATHEA
jgi:hypothetical protein